MSIKASKFDPCILVHISGHVKHVRDLFISLFRIDQSENIFFAAQCLFNVSLVSDPRLYKRQLLLKNNEKKGYGSNKECT